MILSRKLIVMASLAAVVTTAVAFTAPPADGDEGYKNLKILPKDISKEQLHKVMKGFNDALGVHCNFCHAPSKDTTVSKWPDFASDDKPEKDIARSMMKMTLSINKKFFGVKHPAIGEQLEVSCVTCHHGEPHPEEPKEEDHKPGTGGNQPPPPPPVNKQ